MTELVDKAIRKLAAYGYNDVSTELVTDYADSSVQTVLGFCNLAELPSELERVIIDLTCGEVMYNLSFAKTDAAQEGGQTVSSVKEGDTQVTFVTDLTPAQRREMLINTLRTVPYDKLIPYRRLRW